jgi:hypothetical protein
MVHAVGIPYNCTVCTPSAHTPMHCRITIIVGACVRYHKISCLPRLQSICRKKGHIGFSMVISRFLSRAFRWKRFVQEFLQITAAFLAPSQSSSPVTYIPISIKPAVNQGLLDMYMCKASSTFSWIGLVALSNNLVSSQSTWCRWSHWFSAMADFHVSLLLHASHHEEARGQGQLH